MKKNIFFLISTAMLFSFCVPFYAAAGTADVTGTGSVSESGGSYNGSSYGELVNQSINIAVQAKVSGAEIIYDMDIAWGDMNFVYYYGHTWDPETHTYSNVPGENPNGAWMDSYVDGANNCIDLTNNSNFPMQADFTFDMYKENGKGAMNDDTEANGAVAGFFSDSNNTLRLHLNDGYSAGNAFLSDTIVLEMDTTHLVSNDNYYYKNAGGFSSNSEYFTLSGTPDHNRSRSFTTVGTINIAISPVQGASMATIP